MPARSAKEEGVSTRTFSSDCISIPWGIGTSLSTPPPLGPQAQPKFTKWPVPSQPLQSMLLGQASVGFMGLGRSQPFQVPPRMCPALPALLLRVQTSECHLRRCPSGTDLGGGATPDSLGEVTCLIREAWGMCAAHACTRTRRHPSIFTPARPCAHRPCVHRPNTPPHTHTHNASLIFRCSWPRCCWGRVFSIGSCVW